MSIPGGLRREKGERTRRGKREENIQKRREVENGGGR
jgi:hypothetical protein